MTSAAGISAARVRRRDAAATREALLAAGAELFAERGYDGVRVAAIADRAGVNKAMISYHFGGKRQLYLAIVSATFTEIVAGMESLAESSRPAPEVLRELIATVGEMASRRYPHFCSMASCYVKVAPDGSVYPCCYAPAELRMGSIHESSLSEIWNGPAYRAFRRRMFARDYPSPCVTCPVLVRNRERTSVEGRADRG